MTETVITSSVLIIAVLILRTVFKGRISNTARYSLWLMVAVRLALPFGIAESAVSVMNFIGAPSAAEETETLSPVGYEPLNDDPPLPYIDDNEYYPPSDSGIYVTSDIADNNTETFSKEKPSLISVLNTVRLTVTGIMLLWFAVVNTIFYIHLRRNGKIVEYDFPLKIYSVKDLRSPCIFGLFRPSVYITENSLNAPKRFEFIIAHEYCHYLHGDTVWTVLRYILLSVYWFDPLVWAAAILSKRDCECACDEAAVRRVGEENRLEYGKTLLDMLPRKGGTAFGVASTSMSADGRALKERIGFIARKPKTAAAAAALSVIAMLAAAGCTFTSAKTEEIKTLSENSGREGFILIFRTGERTSGERPFFHVQGRAVPVDGENDKFEVQCDIANNTDIPVTVRVSEKFRLGYLSDDTAIIADALSEDVLFGANETKSFTFDVENTAYSEDIGDEKVIRGSLELLITEFPTDFDSTDIDCQWTYSVSGDNGYYYPNMANYALIRYMRTFENYSEYYENGAKYVYIDPVSVEPDEDGRFSAYSNLWIEYSNGGYYTVPLRFSRDTEEWYAENEGRKISYLNQYGTLLENRSFEDIVNASWKSYTQKRCTVYGSDPDPYGINGEPIICTYIMPIEFTEEKQAFSGFVSVSENYHSTEQLMYYPDNPYGFDEDWNWKGTNGFISENDGDFYEFLKTCTPVQTREEYYSPLKYRAGDVIYSFEKTVPVNSAAKKFRIELVMTAENYPNGLPADKDIIQGSFSLRVYDETGQLTGEQPIAVKNADGITEINTSKTWLGQYFRFSGNADELIIFSRHIGFNGQHQYKALFYGLTENGELFPYHIDSGEFPDELHDGDEMYIGNFGDSYDETGVLNYYKNGRSGNTYTSAVHFDRTTHTIKNLSTASDHVSD